MMANTAAILNALLKLDRLICNTDVYDSESEEHVKKLIEIRDQIASGLDD